MQQNAAQVLGRITCQRSRAKSQRIGFITYSFAGIVATLGSGATQLYNFCILVIMFCQTQCYGYLIAGAYPPLVQRPGKYRL
jgi:hypothetical protein